MCRILRDICRRASAHRALRIWRFIQFCLLWKSIICVHGCMREQQNIKKSSYNFYVEHLVRKIVFKSFIFIHLTEH
ncbi:hypothetical protein HanXRQr2_Chr16g0743711 [Helianthus annuus]|uniref:Secreted protein n=1 Tax=Helianthus annuus TaxID=4232 RepID=A0A9K3GXH8_HELAN|nr:hypothetical protein HanXRQr2_Chr16g0743711 [Helianthus annuus]